MLDPSKSIWLVGIVMYIWGHWQGYRSGLKVGRRQFEDRRKAKNANFAETYQK